METPSHATVKDIATRAWQGYAATVVLATLYPTLFVLSQNWYALHASQALWLVAAALVAGLVIYLLVEAVLHAGSWLAAQWRVTLPWQVRPVVFGIVCGAIVSLLLFQTLRHALGDHSLRALAYALIGAVFVVVLLRGARRQLNAFLALLSLVASVSWAIGAMDTSQDWISTVRQDFEAAKFKRKPNIYLMIYDSYTTEDAYRKIFDFDNTTHRQALENRKLKVLDTFGNYRMTLQTAVALFLGTHHYYSTETGFNDTQSGRPFLAGVVHNPVLQTLKANGYALQYIHGLDYFVNEQGMLDYMFPEKPSFSALRVFGTPLLKRKRRITLESQMEALYARLPLPPGDKGTPWFTFVHVNLPSHANLIHDWRRLAAFEQTFREKTATANTHMLALIDRIRARDPEAVVIVLGDHGPHRYNKLAEAADVNAALAEAGATHEIVALDLFGIMIAIGSDGLCDDHIYAGISPVNLMRSLIACLAQDNALHEARVDDITLYRRKSGELVLMARDGKALPAWESFAAPALPH